MIKKLILITICLFCFVSNSFALTYMIKDFSNEVRANTYAQEVNGQVFKEQGQNLWHVIYGNEPILDNRVISFVTEEK